MTNQEIFDTIVTHLRKQGRKALRADMSGGCGYRAEGGLKCAAGCLIPDEDYKQSFEGHSVGSDRPDAEVAVYFASKFPLEQIILIGELQEIHDRMDPFAWEYGFKQLASSNWSLTYTPPSV